jgi:hypothetical protein
MISEDRKHQDDMDSLPFVKELLGHKHVSPRWSEPQEQILRFDIQRCVTPSEAFSEASYADRKNQRPVLYAYS